MANRKNNNRKIAEKVASEVIKKSPKWVIVLAIILLIVCVGGYFVYTKVVKKDTPVTPIVTTGELSFHFLTLGNQYSGDCIYIRAGENDILIDAGSRTNSIDTITSYLKNQKFDGTFEYVIVTHADRDHIACFAGTTHENSSLFDLYHCKIIIDFAKTNSTTETYNRYIAKRDNEVKNDGATHYTALECIKETNGAKKVYNLTTDGSIKFEILYQKFYETKASDENNYSVCTLFTHGDRNFLLTGDLEEDGEESLVEKNKLPEVELFKAGHHGSYTASNDSLLSVIKPKRVVVTCPAGDVEYLTQKPQNLNHSFPAQEFINRVSVYTKYVYVTTLDILEYNSETEKYVNTGFEDMNGNIIVSSSAEKGVTVNCSKNNTLLKDTDWFKTYRTTPPSWAS